MMFGKTISTAYRTREAQSGFTLIELLIAVAILGILAAIIIPSYNAQVRSTNRSFAVTGIMQIAQDLERCRSDTLDYSNGICTAPYAAPVIVPPPPKPGLYSIVVATAPTTYTITATPVAGSTQANDTKCTQFTYNQAGAKTAQDNAAPPNNTTNDCWKQ